ncbi:HEAT repeat domain-containing protein [Corallococcus interemptor]|uniref:HEAT repeat domain-containing protein n=1 Tax=Corallococcus interemptor TaxID=2316720 RepID=UPI003D06DB18
MSPAWHLLTGEYPPAPGGVSDHTRSIAHALLREGGAVHVWTSGADGVTDDQGVTVHRWPGMFTPRGLVRLTRELDATPGPRRLLLLYVPHAFGMKAMNVPFCAWFAARRQDERELFIHEAVYPWSPRAPWKHQVLAGVTRVMLRTLALGVERAYVSIPAWAEHLPEPLRSQARWCPIPSPLPLDVPEEAVQAVRDALGGGPTVAHFGTYGGAIAGPLEAVLVPLLQRDERRQALLLGRGSQGWRDALARKHPALASRLHARDGLGPEAVAAHLRAADVMLQPYPDGISARRSSAMAGLGLRMPIVTNTGHLSEGLWRDHLPVALADDASPAALLALTEQLLEDSKERRALGRRAARIYREHFALEHTVAHLMRLTRNDTAPTPEQRDAALKDLLGDDRTAMVKASKLLCDDKSTTPTLLRFLEAETRVDNRHAILYALTWHSHLAQWDLMVGILKDVREAPLVRGQAAEYLAYNFLKVRTDSVEFKAAVGALLEALKDPSPEVRYCAVHALGSTGHPPLLPALREMLQDTTPAPGWVGTVSSQASERIEWLEHMHEQRLKQGF